MTWDRFALVRGEVRWAAPELLALEHNQRTAVGAINHISEQ